MIMMLAGLARADTIIMKNGIRYESDSVFNMAGAWYYKVDGQTKSVPEDEVEKVVKGSAPAAPQAKPTPAIASLSPATAATPDTSPTAQLLKKAGEAMNKADWQFVRDCRTAIEAEAKRTKSDYKATCAKAVLMVERLYEGTMPADGTFGYYREALNNKVIWEILPEKQSAKLKRMILTDDGPFLKFEQEYLRRIRVQAAKDLAKGEEALRNQQAMQQYQKQILDAQVREHLKSMPQQQYQPNGTFNSHNQYQNHNNNRYQQARDQARQRTQTNNQRRTQSRTTTRTR